MNWELANCRGIDPDLMHPARGESLKEPMAVCEGCVIRPECLAYAMEVQPMGIWGGTTERQRQRIRRAGKAVA